MIDTLFSLRAAWSGIVVVPTTYEETLERALGRIGEPYLVVERAGVLELLDGDLAALDGSVGGSDRIVGYLPACRLEHLGDRGFCAAHRLRYPYMSGAMANGIGSVEIVEAMGRAGMLGIFGAAGLAPAVVETAIDRLGRSLGHAVTHGFNLIHSPSEPALEEAVVALYLRRGVRLVEASAYLDLTLPVVRYRVHGIHRDARGRIVAPNRIIAKVSRVEVATKFLAPPPAKYLRALLAAGEITPEQAEWAALIPMAEDVTAEADSGGHTDNQAGRSSCLPTEDMMALRPGHRMQVRQHAYETPPRIGAAGASSTLGGGAAALGDGGSLRGGGLWSTRRVSRPGRWTPCGGCWLAGAAGRHRHEACRPPTCSCRDGGQASRCSGSGARCSRCTLRSSSSSTAPAVTGSTRSPPPTGPCSKRTSSGSRSNRSGTRPAPSSPSRATRAQLERAKPRRRASDGAGSLRWYLGLSSHLGMNTGEPSRTVDYQIWCPGALGDGRVPNEWGPRARLLQQARGIAARSPSPGSTSCSRGGRSRPRPAALRAAQAASAIPPWRRAPGYRWSAAEPRTAMSP